MLLIVLLDSQVKFISPSRNVRQETAIRLMCIGYCSSCLHVEINKTVFVFFYKFKKAQNSKNL